MPVLDLSAAARVYHGAVEVGSLYRGSTLLWAKPIGNIAFPQDIFDLTSTFGICWDPYHPGVLQAPGGAVATVGTTVGFVPYLGYRWDYAGTARTPNMAQSTAALRPELVEVGGARALQFDASARRLEALIASRFEPGLRFTHFAMVYVDAATDGVATTFNRGETSLSWWEPTHFDAATQVMLPTLRHKSDVFINGSIGYSGDYGWKLIWTEYEIDSFAANGGRVRIWVNGVKSVDAVVSPAKDATANVTILNRAMLGTRRSGGTFTLPFTSAVGRSGFIERLCGAAERLRIEQWLRGTAWVAP